MKKIHLNWLDIVSLIVLGVSFILIFIPLSPSDNGFYSLTTYVAEASNNGESLRIIPFVFYIMLTLTSIALIIFNLKLFYKFSIFGATIFMLLLCINGWPTRLFSMIVAMSYLILLLLIIVVDFFKNGRFFRKDPEKEEDLR